METQAVAQMKVDLILKFANRFSNPEDCIAWCEKLFKKLKLP